MVVPLATAVVFGLGFSTILTLIVTPVWLAAPEKMGRWRTRMINKLLGREEDSIADDPAWEWASKTAGVRQAAE